MADLATLMKSLTTDQKDALKKLLFTEMASETTITDSPGMTMVYNRSPDTFEFQWDSKPHRIEGHKFAVYETGIARHAVRKGQYRHVGTENVEEWIVPKGTPFFGVPMDDNGLTGDPILDYPIDLAPVEGEAAVGPGQREVFVLDRVPPPGPGEPRPVARKTASDNAVGFSKDAVISGGVR